MFGRSKSFGDQCCARVTRNRQQKENATIIEKVEKCRDFLSGFDNPAAAFRHLEASTKQQDDAIHIGTIHGSKGLEWRQCF